MRTDFSGILLCSDYDGTLTCRKGYVEENTAAIEYFTSHGGLFTLATGRSGENLLAGAAKFPVNAPLAALNGSQIYDLSRGSALEKYYVEDAEKITRLVAEVCDIDTVQVVNDGGFDGNMPRVPLSEAVFTDRVYKVCFFKEGGFGEAIPEKVVRAVGDTCTLISNGSNSFEVNAKGVSKGFGALRIKELTGARTLVCVGDWYGDITMLEAADIGYAVGNANESVKAAADRVTVDSSLGAIAKIVSEF